MKSIIASTRVIVSLLALTFGAASIAGLLLNPGQIHILFIALIMFVITSSLISPNIIITIIAIIAAIGAYAASLLTGLKPLGTSNDLIIGSSIFIITGFIAWLISRHLGNVEKTLARQSNLIEGLTMYEPSTGEIRKTYFQSIVDFELNRARRYKLPMSILAIQCTDEGAAFHKPNGAPSTLRKDLIKQHQEMIRNVDRVGQGFDDEWFLLLSHTDGDGSQILANRLVQSAKDQLDAKITIGVATFPEDGTDANNMLTESRAALDFARLNAMPIVSRSIFEKHIDKIEAGVPERKTDKIPSSAVNIMVNVKITDEKDEPYKHAIAGIFMNGKLKGTYEYKDSFSFPMSSDQPLTLAIKASGYEPWVEDIEPGKSDSSEINILAKLKK